MTTDEARLLLKQSIDPITLTAIGITAGMAGVATKRMIERMLQKKAWQYEEDLPVRRARRQLHRMVRPVAKGLPYKTKGAQGWDVMVDAVLSDSQATAAK